ncbi:MAG: UbiD family decarboxylase [Proteobacteria bacterium]|nr:UbiD family decarboxylase [Pseudomonadota bacterium]
MGALSRYLISKDIGPVILDNLEGYNTPGVPLIINLFGSPERTAMIMGTKKWEEASAIQTRVMKESWPEPKVIPNGPCKQVIIKEHNIDLRKQIPKVWFTEGQAFITGLVTVSKDPETGEKNVGWYRYGFFDTHPQTGALYSEEKRKRCLQGYIFWNPPLSHIGRQFAKAVKMGKPLEVAIVGPCDPTIHAAACTDMPYGKDEFAFAGAMRGGPVELVKCETVDLLVPASAEWVLEGEVIPGTDELNWGHAHGMGYLDFGYVLPSIRIKCITHRENPLWYATTESKPPWDHQYIIFLNRYLLESIRSHIPEVKDITMPVPGITVIQLAIDGADREPEIGKRVMNALWSMPRLPGVYKFVVVVGPDINPYDIQEIGWALWTRCQPIRDSISQKVLAMFEDPSVPEELEGPQKNKLIGEVIGFDALIKVPEYYPKFQKVVEPSKEEVEKISAKLSQELSN